MSKWITVEAAAPLLSMKPYQIYRAIREGIFPFEYVKIGKQIRILASSSDGLERKESQYDDAAHSLNGLEIAV